MPDILIDQDGISFAKPCWIQTGGGQYPLMNAARAWTAIWMLREALGLEAIRKGSSHQVRLSLRLGGGSFLSNLQPNPLFYELIMGWPTNWSAPEGQVTGFAVWLQRSRLQLWMRLSAMSEHLHGKIH